MMIFNTRFGRLFFFSTEPQACSYLPEREAVMLFADPNKIIDTDTYARLIDYGFRRSGDNVYRPHCRSCTACIPVRIPVDDFRPNRSQRRNWRANGDLRVHTGLTRFEDRHLQLYLRYQRHRHDGATSEGDARDQLGFLRSRFIDTSFAEFYAGDELVMVTVIDRLPQGLSAVYTFYDDSYAARGLGVHAVLYLVEECRRLGLPWLYLGYWIKACSKMSYKDQFRPLEVYVNGGWRELSADMQVPT